MNRTNIPIVKNNILKSLSRLRDKASSADKGVKFVLAARIVRFFDPVSFFYRKTDKYYLSPSEIDQMIDDFKPGNIDDVGWGELIIDDQDEDGRLYLSLSSEELGRKYCEHYILDYWDWVKDCPDWYDAYARFGDQVEHTYIDSWTDRIVKTIQP